MSNDPRSNVLDRRAFLASTGSIFSIGPALTGETANRETKTVLPFDLPSLSHPVGQNRPVWWREGGLVIVGVDWESLLLRIRAGGNPDFPPTFSDYNEELAVWRSEHSEEIARRLKDMGFNFLMIPLYKGGQNLPSIRTPRGLLYL